MIILQNTRKTGMNKNSYTRKLKTCLYSMTLTLDSNKSNKYLQLRTKIQPQHPEITGKLPLNS